MCGIAGEVTWAGLRPRTLERASDALRHRGPDDHGVWRDERCSFVHRRLAVLDPSPAGHQPMVSDDGRWVLTFNGEVFDFARVRADLEALGWRFRTATDTEVLLAAYREWGVGCLARLNGMFAFAIWDSHERTLVLARDRLGEKPLFHATVGGRFRFASELTALLADGDLPRTPDLGVVDDYLTLGYVPAPRTAFAAIQALEPAHWMRVDLRGDRPVVHTERWWDVAYEPKVELDEGEAVAEVRATLTDAVRLRTVSDVPVGALLSGGVDSSAVVGLLAAQGPGRLQTFSVGFEDPALDERVHARRVAERFGTEHHEAVVPAPDADLVIDLVRHHGQPFADSSSVPTWVVSRLARDHVTVVLTGDGGDEAFAGYPRHRANRLASRRPEPDSQSTAQRHLAWTATFDDRLKGALYGADLRAVFDPRRLADTTAALTRGAVDALDQGLAIDTRSYLPGDLLAKLDTASMAHGLEARAPFLDHRLVELAARLPGGMKLRGSRAKHVLLEATADLVPAENVARPKMGFTGPVAEWLRGPLRPLLRDALLSPGPTDGWFDQRGLVALLDEHDARRVDHSGRLWALLVLELWHRSLC